MMPKENEFLAKLSADLQSRCVNVAWITLCTITILYGLICAAFNLYGRLTAEAREGFNPSPSNTGRLHLGVLGAALCTFFPISAIMFLEKCTSMGKKHEVWPHNPLGYLSIPEFTNARTLFQLACLSASQCTLFYFVVFALPGRPVFLMAPRGSNLIQPNPAAVFTLLYTTFLCSVFLVKSGGFKITDKTQSEFNVSKPSICRVPCYKILKTEAVRAARLLLAYTIFHFFLGETLYSVITFVFTKCLRLRFRLQENTTMVLKDYKLMAGIYLSGFISLALLSFVAHVFRITILDDPIDKYTIDMRSLMHGLALPENSLTKHFSFRKVAHIAEYNPAFRADLYVTNDANHAPWQDLYDILLRELYDLNEKLSAKLKLIRPPETAKSDTSAAAIPNDQRGDKESSYISLYLYLAQWTAGCAKKAEDEVHAPQPKPRPLATTWLLAFAPSRRLLAEKSQKDDLLVFKNYQTAIWAAKCLAALTLHASDDCYEVVSDILPIVLTICTGTLQSLDDWLGYISQHLSTSVVRTPYADTAIYKAEALRDVLETCIYSITSAHYDSLQRCDFSSKCCDKLQLFADFRY